MSLSLYIEGRPIKERDSSTLNTITLNPDNFRIFTPTIPKNHLQESVKKQEQSSNWILNEKGIFRCIKGDKDICNGTTMYFTSQYYSYLHSIGSIKDSFTKLMLEPIILEDINDFYLVTDDTTIEYVIEHWKDLHRFIKHDIIRQNIHDYLVNNKTALIHNQIFLIPYKNDKISDREILVPIRLIINSSGDKRKYIDMMNCKGLRFSELSTNINLIPSSIIKSNMTNLSYVYSLEESIKSLQIIWKCIRAEHGVSHFIDIQTIKKHIVDSINHYAIKIGSEGHIHIGSADLEFKIIKINNNESISSDPLKQNIYHLSDLPIDYIYTKTDNTNNTNNIIINDTVNTNLNMELLYEPTLNGDIIFIDSLKEQIPATYVSVDVKCSTNGTNTQEDHLLWRKEHTDVVCNMLASQKTIGAAILTMNIKGVNSEFRILNCEPRNTYNFGKYYGACASIYYKEGYTKLNICAKTNTKTASGDTMKIIKVIVVDDVENDSVVSMDCVVKKTNVNHNIKVDGMYDIYEVLKLLQQPKTETKIEMLMMDESRLRSDVIKSGIVWENKQIDFIVAQYNISICVILKNIVWKNEFANKSDKTCDILTFGQSVHTGMLNVNIAKIKWVYDEDIYIVPKENVYREHTYNEILKWSKQNKIGGLDNILWDAYRHLIVLRNPNTINTLKRNGLKPSKGVIFYGPPGNGKTKIARSLGKLLGSRDEHIILCSATELLSKWLGESEKNVAKLFEPAERAYSVFGSRAPLYTVIIDEIDIIAQQRGSYNDSTGARDGMVNQLLTKIDGSIEKDNIIIVGLTNREKILDEALLREGRLDRMICIGYPNLNSRCEIFDLYVRPWISKSSSSIVNSQILSAINILADKTEGFSGADIQGFVSYVIKEYWSTLLGKTSKKIDKNHVPLNFFTCLLDEYKKDKCC
jgi:hypothetical protein